MDQVELVKSKSSFKYDSSFLKNLLLLAEEYEDLVYEHGACVNQNAQDIFYNDKLQDKAISLYCNQCSVTVECLKWALITGEEHLVWGGVTDIERRKAIKSVRIETKNIDGEFYPSILPSNPELWNKLLQKFFG